MMYEANRGNASRAEICARVAVLRHDLASVPVAELVAELDDIRRIALRQGIGPALSVIHALDQALARGERGAMVCDWLDILHDACGCEIATAGGSAIFNAAVSVRLS